MKGKILDNNIISGEDGNRYSFSPNDIVNLEGKSTNNLTNCEVDFMIDENTAKSIYIINQSLNMSLFGSYDDINSIKIKAYVYLACSLLGTIPTIGTLFSIVGIIFLILAVRGITKISNIPLLKNLVLYWVLNFIGLIMISISLVGAFLGSINNNSFLAGIGITGLIGFALIIAGAIFSYFYYKNLYIATNEKFFIYAFITRTIASLTYITLFLFIIFLVISIILEAIAWFKFKEIKQQNN